MKYINEYIKRMTKNTRENEWEIGKLVKNEKIQNKWKYDTIRGNGCDDDDKNMSLKNWDVYKAILKS